MTKNSEYIIPKEKPFETVYELKNEVPSFEEFMKSYESGTNYADLNSGDIGEVGGYGPCKNFLCGCSCSANECICSNYTGYQGGLVKKGKMVKVGGEKVNVRGFQHLIHTFNDLSDKNDGPSTSRGELWSEEITAQSDGFFRAGRITTSAGANVGVGGAIAGGGLNCSMAGFKDYGGEVNFISGSIGGEIGAGAGGVVAGYSLGVDAVNVQAGGFRANFGVDAGSGVSLGAGGVEAKVAGFGFSVGKKMGISTPIGGLSVDLEESCVVQ